jgi:cytochrome c biogenesis protein CcmG, thiol:disulfide interchange protein DsbE
MSTAPRAPVAAWIIPIILFAIAGVIFVTSLQRSATVPLTGDQSTGSAHVGSRAPEVGLVALDGKQVSLSNFRGKPVWVNFFATWCPPCKDELPEIERRYERAQPRGLVVLGVDQQEKPAQVKPFIARFGLRYPVVIDEAGQGAITYNLIALPTSVFIDRGGVVRFIQIGQMSPALMDAALKKIL